MKHCLFLLLLLAPLLPSVQAQGVCSSDAQPQPVRLLERFLSADCEACWSRASTQASAKNQASGHSDQVLTLDWILPSRQGDEAALSGAASRDALLRLQTLGRPAPAREMQLSSAVPKRSAYRLRVAHGVALGGYIGASIEVRGMPSPTAASPTPTPGGSQRGETTAVLLLVETIAAGTEGTPITRHLVRNMLQIPWPGVNATGHQEPPSLLERRPLSVPSGAQAQRLRVVGWLQDRQGRLLAAAQSACLPELEDTASTPP
ncbi:MAG: hypothetical protein EBQ71_01335 [Betaproteobacteria bacterium]|nr:hypothetical protein [Betaproteobacteria bacterium]